MSKEKPINLEVLPELEEYIVPLQKDEYTQLEKNIIKEGCREPLIVWPRTKTKILIDGHNRYWICIKHNISFKISEIQLNNIENAKLWVINNQLGRRNLNRDQMSYYRGLKYESLKKERGGYSHILSKGQNGPTTAERLSKEFNVSDTTIKRDSKFARGLEFIADQNPLLKKKIINGEIKIKKSIINFLSEPDYQKKIRKIINEVDLELKVKKIREDILKNTEDQFINNKEQRIAKAQAALAEKEPIFLEFEDKIIRIKGMILSNLNKAIKNRDVKTLEEIRKLIDRLQVILD